MNLPKYITAIPKKNSKDVVGEGTGMFAIVANDVEYIENRSYKGKVKGFNLQWYLVGFFVFVFVLARPYKGVTEFLMFLPFGAGLIYAYLYHYIAPKKHFVANRQTGKLRVPISMKKPAIWINFEDGFALEKTVYMDNIYTTLFFQTKPEVAPGAAFRLADWEREDYWNFFVWYMDKNRPLPPGKAFDEYRQRDFERRRAEGFPKPLYEGAIPTPEATEEQQKERLLIGGW